MKKSARCSGERLKRPLFFFGALLLHLVLFLMVVGYVVIPSVPVPKEVAFHGFLPPAPVTPPPVPMADTSRSGAPGLHDLAPPILGPGDNASFNLPPAHFGEVPGMTPGPAPLRDHRVPSGRDRSFGPSAPVDLEKVREVHRLWDPQGTGRFKFPIYLARYADGDWDCNNFFNEGRLTSGCLPNLLAKVKEWSHGEMEASDIRVVALDSPELIDEPPPFLFFTGHKDFVLTEAEVVMLRKYLQAGGAIWGDSAFAGNGSRFDVSFHREMKRVLPDRDRSFEPVPADHPIFSARSRFQIDELPRGMNRRADPIECIDLGGKLAVIYTPNDYSDLMTLHLLPGESPREAQMGPEDRWRPLSPLYTPGDFAFHQASYFRNYRADSAMLTFKLSTNILVYLIHRFDAELELTP